MIHVERTASSTSWDDDDLARRVALAIEMAHRALALTHGRPQRHLAGVPRLVAATVVTESAMLVRCAGPAAAKRPELAPLLDHLARALRVPARPPDLAARVCAAPHEAVEMAAAHVHLSALGHCDTGLDAVVAAAIDDGVNGGPERTPGHELEHAWLRWVHASASTGRRLAAIDHAARAAELLGRTSLVTGVDVVTASQHDWYVVAHAVAHGTDLGRAPIGASTHVARPAAEIAADIDAGVAIALDAGCFDLVAELLWAFPMFGVDWTDTGRFAADVVARAQDRCGVVPGPGWVAPRHVDPGWRDEHVVRTSYHATLVMGVLAAAALGADRPPRATALPGVAGNPARRRLAQRLVDLLDGDLARAPSPDPGPRPVDLGDDVPLPVLVTIACRRAVDLSRFDLLAAIVDAVRRHDAEDGADGPGEGLVDTLPVVRSSEAALRRAALAAERAGQELVVVLPGSPLASSAAATDSSTPSPA